MTDTEKPNRFQSTQPHRLPCARPRSGEGFWTRIGSAWQHADGNGFNIQIETVPLDGRITLRVAVREKAHNASTGRASRPALHPREFQHEP